ncbi:Insulin-degrading enzyme [Hypsibius exemplaris]|uniref:Insulin-degrading enzyme n=1 Tax=Hypsibius exemplaris TaxID=2072580 RepID=A0A1W0XAH3_HYPEX|nr:Insulin-degrading enzyme [Hypsibius exemplaris]
MSELIIGNFISCLLGTAASPHGMQLLSRCIGILIRLHPHCIISGRRMVNTVASELPSVVIKNAIENIPKSPQDSRGYRGLVLGNDLKVLLISDPATEKAAAALDVHIGCMMDPWKLQGLAHFLEHMLFMGTEKYPEENAFEKYVSEHGGQYNAYTCEEHTNYHFDVAADYLETSLDRFAQFFIAPLLTESSTEREVNAVNSEHENNLTSDSRRLDHLSRTTGDPKHDFNKFGTGSKATLWFNPLKEGVRVREELLKFHDTYYSSNIMCLVVIGKESLDALTEMVGGMFSLVPNKHVVIPHWKDAPFKTEHFKTQLNVVPVKDIRSLNIVWNIPDLHTFYKSKPGHYLGSLVGHEGPGSLLSALKTKGWSNTLHAGEDDGANGFQFFVVGVDLTEEGLKHTDEIVTMVFEYLNLLRDAGPQERIWREEQKIQELKFRFRDKEKPIGYARGLAATMQKYAIPEVLTGPVLLSEYQPETITDLLSHLTPDKLRISILSKSFKDVTMQKEPIYGIDYALKPIPEGVIKAWSDAGQSSVVSLPPPNEFIPEHFELLSAPENTQRLPALIRKTDFGRLWYLQDVVHKLPKAVAFFELCSPTVYRDPIHANMAHLFVELFRDSINEVVYMAELSGMKYLIEQSKYGLTLSVRGYDDKLDVLLKILMDKLVHFKPDLNRFNVLKEVYGRQLKNFFATEPNRQSTWYFNVLMSEICFTKEALMETLNDLTYEKFSAMAPDLFKDVYVEGFVFGNVSRKKAESFLEEVESSLRSVNAKPIAPVDRMRLVKLAEGSELVYHRENEVHKSSSVTTYYQCAFENPRMNMLLELFEQITNEPCFDILRTKEQLGYIVFSQVKNVSGVLGLQVLVQSHKSPEHVDERIESFLREMQPFVAALTDAEFATHVEALAVRRLEKPKTIAQQATKFWNEIYVRQYNFDRDATEVAELRKLTKEDLNGFITEYLLPGGKQRKKFTIHITSTVPADAVSRKRPSVDMEGTDSEETGDDDSEDDIEMAQSAELPPPGDIVSPVKTGNKCDAIRDIEHFKKKMGFHPVPPVYIDIDTVLPDQ